MIGQTVAHYQIEGILGEGGMGIVYKARDLNLDRLVAIKFLRSDRYSDAKDLRRFIQEAKAASSLDHPNICTIYEIATASNGQLFIAMAYYDGKTLRRIMADGPLLIGDSLKYTSDIAKGLAKAHSNNLVHRDIKPENIIITVDGIAKILDFGLVKLTLDATTTMSDGFCGTIGYMSPEQIHGQVDQRTDLWSLGVVLYEMITGRRPFNGEQPAELLRSIANDGYPPAGALCDGMSREVEDLIARSLAKNPSDRFQRAEELLAHLHIVRQGTQCSSTFIIPSVDSSPTSIAVLPFVNLSHDEETEYFSDGLTDELIHLLSQVRGLMVVSHTSAFEFKGKSLDIRSIAARLNVGSILEGSVRRAGNRLRITAQLTDAVAGYHRWSERYDRELKDIFAIQEEIALSIVNLLKVKQKAEIVPFKPRYEGNIEAHACYLRGRYFSAQKTEEGFRKARQAFQEAIAIDANCAPAYAGLADYYVGLGFWGVMPPNDAWNLARELAVKSMRIDNRLAEAEISLAKCVLFGDWDWRQAEERFQRAIELDPSLSGGHFYYAILLIQLGRFGSALAELESARALDPLSLTVTTGFAWANYYLGRYDRASLECKQALDLRPEYVEAQVCMGLIALKEGRPVDAVSWFEAALAASGGSSLGLGLLGYGYALSNRKPEAMKVLEQLTKLAEYHYVSPIASALVNIGLSNHEEAFTWLEKAYTARDALLAYANVFPPYESLRDSPRFRSLLDKIGLAKEYEQQTV
jgi:eukaryotic-like serine/threonine-protein kinase